ncbi:MAG: hypothetical protein AAGA93_25695 [Actinomycetota bacterium]
MDLRELRSILSRYILIAVGVFYLCVAGGVLAAFLPDKVYATSATLEMEINNEIDAGGGAVQQASFMLAALQETARSRSLKERVAPDVAEEFRTTRVDITATGQSSVIKVRGESGSPYAAEAWVNAVADRLVEEHPDDSAIVLGVIDRAPVKLRPISPNTEPIIVASVVVGLVAAVFAALAADRVKRAFDTASAIRDRLDTTILGEIPALSRWRREKRKPLLSLLSGDRANSDLVTAFDALRTNVGVRMAQVGADKVAIVSMDRSTGKSTVTAGLAHSMAAVRATVAIEADLRRPRLSERLEVRNAHGIGDMAAFGHDLILQRTAHPNLRLLPAGIPVSRPADAISTTIPFVFNRLAESGDMVFVDSPPLVGAVETSILVAETKWVILVISGSGHDYAAMSQALQTINEAGGTLLGVVVNRVSRRRFRSKGYSVIDRQLQDWTDEARIEPPAAPSPPTPAVLERD